MSELDERMYDAMKDKFPWAQDRPLSTKLHGIIEQAQKNGTSKATAYEECMRVTVAHLMPLIETTGISCLFVTAALRVIADITEKHLDGWEKMISTVLYRGASVESSTITVRREKK